jgi:hypothetical protein
MTRNEKVAEKCGWKVQSDGIVFDADEYYIGHIINVGSSIFFAHLLIERMVADGLEVVMRIYGKNYGAMALEHVYHNDPDDIETHCHGSVNDAPDFPAAVVELFCVVYDIKGD